MTRRLHVLITNHALSGRAGSELYVRDLARALVDRGHAPVVYSPEIGEVAREIRAATVPVVDELGTLGRPPDLIHAHHHLETMTALMRFPETPAIYVCHGWLPFEEAPPRHPRILRYVGVDDVCRDRLELEHGVPAERIRVLLNFVDLDRVRSRGPLPEHPARALIYSNNARSKGYVEVVRRAAAASGLRVDTAGARSGRVVTHPDRLLRDYDLVFAKGRAALEALAVGCAVILCDAAGSGPLVTLQDVDALRRLNLGLRALRGPHDPATLAGEIARYNAADATAVSRRIRASAGLASVVDQFLDLYSEVLDEWREGTRPDPVAEGRAVADYLRWLSMNLRRRGAHKASRASRLRQRLLATPLLRRLTARGRRMPEDGSGAA